jgi:hypothetical protein
MELTQRKLEIRHNAFVLSRSGRGQVVNPRHCETPTSYASRAGLSADAGRPDHMAVERAG